MRGITLLLLLIMITIAPNAFAVGEDIPWLMKMLAESKKKLKTAQDTFDTAQKIENDGNFVKNALTGHYKMGDLVSMPLKSQQWSPGAWSNAIQNTQDGASMQYLQATSAFRDSHELLSETDFVKAGGTEADYKQYKEQWQTDRVASAVAETAYNKINKDEADIKTLQNHIEAAPNEKAAQDLRNRIAVEQADINVQEQRIKTVQLKLEAEKHAQDLDAEKKEAEFEK